MAFNYKNLKTTGDEGNGQGMEEDRIMVVDLERCETDRRSKEIEDRRKNEMEPIVRRPMIQRTPPPKGKPSAIGEKTGQKDLTDERPSIIKRSGLTKSPTNKLIRQGSFSEVESKIRFGNFRDRTTEKRRRSDTDDQDENCSSKSRRPALQLIKEKLAELKKEMENEVLKTSSMVSMVEDLCVLTAQAEVEEQINAEESRDGGALRQRRIINGKISHVKTYNQFKEVEPMDWPVKCFKRTERKSGTFPIDKGDIIFLRNDGDPDMEKGIARRLRENFPEIIQLKEDRWETLITSSRRASQPEHQAEWEKRIHIGKYVEGEALYNELKKLKELMIRLKSNRGVMPLEKDFADKESLLKMLECIFHDTNINFDVYSQDFLTAQVRKKKTFQSSALLVKTSRENYAETLKKVKSQVMQSEKKIEFRKIRSTRDGNMIIELKEGDEDLGLEEVIGKEGGGIEVKLLPKARKEGEKYIIRDLDGLIAKEEIEEVLKESTITDEEKDAVRVISVRKIEGDTQTAIVHLHPTQGERIIGAGGITIGLIKSTLRKWVDVVKCYRCWEIGHRATQCKGVDRTKACSRCGGTDGHKARECRNADYCPLCQREGHRAGTGLCPKMRSAIAGLRRQQAMSRRLSRK